MPDFGAVNGKGVGAGQLAALSEAGLGGSSAEMTRKAVDGDLRFHCCDALGKHDLIPDFVDGALFVLQTNQLSPIVSEGATGWAAGGANKQETEPTMHSPSPFAAALQDETIRKLL